MTLMSGTAVPMTRSICLASVLVHDRGAAGTLVSRCCGAERPPAGILRSMTPSCPTPPTAAIGRSPVAPTSSRSAANDVFLSGKGVMFESSPRRAPRASQSPSWRWNPPRHTSCERSQAPGSTPRQVLRIEVSIPVERQAPSAKSSEPPAAARISSHLCQGTAQPLRCRTWVFIPNPIASTWPTPPDAMVVVGRPGYPKKEKDRKVRQPMSCLFENQIYVHQVAGALAAERRAHPGDDLIIGLVNADVEGKPLLPSAYVAAFLFFLLLSVAATPKKTPSRPPGPAMNALTDFPVGEGLADGGFSTR